MSGFYWPDKVEESTAFWDPEPQTPVSTDFVRHEEVVEGQNRIVDAVQALIAVVASQEAVTIPEFPTAPVVPSEVLMSLRQLLVLASQDSGREQELIAALTEIRTSLEKQSKKLNAAAMGGGGGSGFTVNGRPVDDSNPVPITGGATGGLTNTQLRATPVDVNISSGTITFPAEVEVKNDAGTALSVTAASLPLPAGAATETTLSYGWGKPGQSRLWKSGTISASGDTDFITPTAGKRLRIIWVSVLPDSDASSSNLVGVKFAAGGVPFYLTYALGHREIFEGAVDEHLFINCLTANKIAVTVHYEEF